MKDYMQCYYTELGPGRHRSREQYRRIVRETWNLEFDGKGLGDLIKLMPQRRNAVNDTNDRYVNHQTELDKINKMNQCTL